MSQSTRDTPENLRQHFILMGMRDCAQRECEAACRAREWVRMAANGKSRPYRLSGVGLANNIVYICPLKQIKLFFYDIINTYL